MQRVKLGLVCLSWLCLAGAVSAQTELDPASNSGIASVQNYSGGGLLNGTYFDVRHVIGDGVGYQNSYSQLGAFAPFWLNEDAFIAPNTRLIVTNSTQIGFNTGAVARQYVNGLDRIFGVYGYYDDDQDSRNFRYSQFTVGAETLGQWWDARANGYFLTGTDNNFMQALGVVGNPFYFNNSVGFIGQQLRDQALGGADAEVGMPLSPRTPWMRGYAGLYGLHANASDTVGFRGRFEAMVSNDLTLGVTVAQDAIYGTNINGTIDFKFSGFQPTRFFPNLTTRQRMLNPVQRNWRIATRTYVQDVEVAANNPATGQPYFIVHVDNSAPAGGNGTIEHPFNHLVNAPQADIILVHEGLANSAATAVTGSTVLSNNERLLGTGLISTMPIYVNYGGSSISQTINVPGTSSTGIYPYITNPGGNIVTLANNNEVFGLNLVNSGGTAITNTAAGSNNFLLHNLNITGNAGKGIDLTNASGAGVISYINTGAKDDANPLGLGNNAGGGIQVSSTNPGLFLQLSNVYMNATPAGSQAYGISLSAPSGTMVAELNNVFTNGNTNGILLSENSQELAVTMNSVRAENNTGTGISISGTGGSITVNGTNVGSLNNGGDNLDIGTQAAPIMTSTVVATFNTSNFSNSATGSGIVFSQSGGTGTLNLPWATSTTPGSTVAGNAVDGLAIYATNGTLMNANVQNGFFGNNGRDAFHVEANAGSTVNLNVDPTDASRSGRDGLYFLLGQDSVLNTVFQNDNLNVSGGSAVYGILQDLATVNLFFNQTTGAFSGGDGFYVNAMNNSVANLEVDNGTFAGSGRIVGGSSAINIQSNDSRVNILTDMTLGNNIAQSGLQGNQAYGLTLNLTNSSVFNGTFQNGDFSQALVDAMNINVTSGSNATMTVFNTSGDGSGFDGLVVNVNDATLSASFANNSNFSLSGRDGMNFHVANGGVMTTTFDNSSFNNNGVNNSTGSGIYGIVTGATSVANVNLVDNSEVNNNTASGLDFNVNAGALNVTALSSSFDSNGTAGVIGSGVLGVVNNDGVARLDFINVDVNENLDNGIFVTTTTGSSIQAAFSIGSIANNGSTLLSAHNNDGILLQMDDSGFSSLNVSNGAQILNNGNDGIGIVATNGTNFQGLFDSINILNNGTAPPPFTGTRAGVDITTATNSQVNLSFNGDTIGNSGAGGTQLEGILSTTTTGGLLTASLTTVNLQNNQIDAMNTTVATNGTAMFSLVNVSGDNSGATGALFNVTSGGNLTVFSSVNSSFSLEGGSGILVAVDGATSQANFDLDSINLTGNGLVFGGQGFSGLATNGGTLNVVITNGDLDNNANQGIEITAANANTVANFEVDGTQVSFNSSQGLLINVSDQAQVNYRSVGSNYDNNGANGPLDGVTVNVTGNGPANSATALLLFANGTVDGNQRNGFLLNATNGATLTTSIQDENISNNQQFGIESIATGANTQFNLLMTGTNTLTGNGAGSFNQFDFSNLNQVVLEISGTFNNPTGDGVHVDLENIVNAAVAIEGPGSIDNSGGNGIFVNMDTITNASLLINGFTEINNSALDGIQVRFNNVANGAIQLEGPTTINTSGGDGIDMLLTNTNLVNNLSYGLSNIQILTLTNNLPEPFNGQLPIPVTVALDSLGITPQNALVVDSMTINGSADSGISIVATNTNIAANGSFITNNVVGTSLNGDGVVLNFNTVTADGLVIANNGMQGNSGNGLNLELTNTPINGLVIAGNNGGSSFAAGTLNFSFNNLIWTTFMNNNSSAGLNIAQVSLDLANAVQTQVWRPDLTPFTTPLPGAFEPTAPTDVTVGLDSVDGTPIVPGNYPVQGTGGNVLPFGGVPVGSDVLTLGFNSFTPGSQLEYSLAHGPAAGTTLLDGTTFTGATGTVTLADGRTASGVFTNSGLQITKVFAGVSDGISGNGLDGIKISLNNSSLTNLSVNNNTLSGNGTTTTTGNGIEITGTGGAVVNSDITNAQFNNNSITANQGDGIRLVNPATVSNTISVAFNNNNVSTNTGTGINLSVAKGLQNLEASFASNTVNSNTGGGINIVTGDNRNMTGGFDSNTVNQNGTQGINISLGVNGVLTSNFTNNIINANTSDGIKITLNTGGSFEGAQFYGNQIGATGAGNGGMGVRLTVPDGASFNWNLGSLNQNSNTIVGNTGAGVGIAMSGASSGVLNVANSSFTNTLTSADPNFTGDGLRVDQTGTSVMTGSIVDSNFSNNADDGAKFTVPGNNSGLFAQLNNFTVGGATAALGNTFNNNGGNGLEFDRTADGEISNITIQNSTFDSNTLNGLSITAANKLRVDTYTAINDDFSKNGQNGVLLDEQADANISFNMSLSTLTNNGSNGIQLIEKINSSTDNRALTGTWTQNVITGNAGNGIAIDGATNNLVIGDPTNTNLGNVIANNSLNGIEVSGAGSMIIGSNMITGNGTLGNLNTATENAGVLMNVAPFSDITVENNLISGNFGDGVQYQIAAGFNGFESIVSIHDNTITSNSGRGVNLISRGSNVTEADISNNSITANKLEGVYIVYTSSTDQAIWASSTTPLLADANVFQTGNLLLHMVGNQIIGNGANSGLSGTGLVIRVGTSDGGQGPFDTGGFASSGASVPQGADFATFLADVNPERGGVIAQIDNNTLGGNFGNDVLFHSFTSTVNPITAAGTWNATTFTITAYQSDPLSRFDLYFRGNTTDPNSTDVVGTGDTGFAGFGTRNPALAAFYNDADGVFKSRLNTIAANAAPGPFNSATRARNATRQAAFLPPFNTPPGPHILYPGIGPSTWRVSADSQTALFPLDIAPYTSAFDANGFILPPIGNNGELPYGYGSF